jgi:alpha-amylase/alpha-mannosidase (GH57 family)
MEVTPGQSVAIFGWWDQPRNIVTWDDVKAKKLSWRQLRRLRFSSAALKQLQPDKLEWIHHSLLTLHDMVDTIVFPVNPIVDMRADLGEVWSMQWTPDQMLDMRLTYDDLVSKGLTIQIMAHFSFPLSMWMQLGFAEQHIKGDDMSKHVFGLSETELRNIMRHSV